MARAHDGCQRTRGHWEDQQRFRHRGDIDRVNGLDRASPTQSFLLDSATSPRPVLRFRPSMSIAVPDPTSFLAIDFETATSRRDSACAIGLAVGCAGRVVLSRTYLIRPPTTRFTFSDLHGLTWKDVRDAPSFAEFWPTLRAWIDSAAFLAAHNAPFDRSVLHACCARYRLQPPRALFTCTVQLARTRWGIHPTTLPDVCRRCTFRSAITTPNQTQRHAHASCSSPRLNAHRIAPHPPRAVAPPRVSRGGPHPSDKSAASSFPDHGQVVDQGRP